MTLHWSFLHSMSRWVTDLPGDLPLYPQPILQGFFLKASRFRRPCVGTRATFWSRCRQSLQDGVGEVFNSRVNCHPVV